jgi:hypothetical protein
MTPPGEKAVSTAAAARFAVERLGFGVRNSSRSIWLHGASLSQFVAATEFVRDVMTGRSDLALVATAPDVATVEALRERFPDDVVVAPPRTAARSVERFLDRLQPCALVLLDGGESLDGATLARVRASTLPIHTFDDNVCDRERRAAAEALRQLVPVTTSGASVNPTWHVRSLRDRVADSRAWKSVAPIFMRRRIDDWQSLRRRLAHPRSVLCLGNGPSSEDSRIASFEHDCLIRVNWRWRERGFLVEPDIVFVGDAATIYKVPSCIFALWSGRVERSMLLRHLATRGPRAMEYITVERLSPLAAAGRWPARPSNGALAVLTGAALATERLIIAGMDLFRHPEGRYPGLPGARNEYAPTHHIDTELAIIDCALSGFAGEVVILSDILREQLDVFRGRMRRAG